MKQKTNGIKTMVFIFTLIFVLVAILGSSFAWFSSKDGIINHFDMPDMEFGAKVIDVFSEPETFSPGDTAIKEVGAINTKDIRAFVRLMVQPSIVSADGQPLEALSGKQIELIGLNTRNWKYGDDGYYYYLNILGPAGSDTDKSELLFTAVKLSDSVGDIYKDAKMNIVIKTEAVDTKKWNYRFSWWGTNNSPPVSPLADIDAILSPKAE